MGVTLGQGGVRSPSHYLCCDCHHLSFHEEAAGWQDGAERPDLPFERLSPAFTELWVCLLFGQGYSMSRRAPLLEWQGWAADTGVGVGGGLRREKLQSSNFFTDFDQAQRYQHTDWCLTRATIPGSDLTFNSTVSWQKIEDRGTYETVLWLCNQQNSLLWDPWQSMTLGPY